MKQHIEIYEYPNGSVLICETMDWLESAAVSLSTLAGCVYDPDSKWGLANMTSDMIQRGCGNLNSRQFAEHLDRLGVDRGASVTQAHTSFVASTLRESLEGVLRTFAELLLRPHFPEDQLEDSRQVCLQELSALEDDLAHRTMEHLRSMTYPHPWGRTPTGNVEDVESLTQRDIVEFHRRHYVPQETIISVAGNVEFARIRDLVGELLDEWQGPEPAEIRTTAPKGTYEHIPHESNQTQIAVAYPSVRYAHPDYFQARAAVGVLSDGMSSRLFTEVRENRGLCYTIYASSHTLKDEGRVLCYAGTTTQRAQETLDVMLAEIVKLGQGIHQHELGRLKARIKSALIMQQESSTARANANSGDWYHLGHVRTFEELNQFVDALSVESIGDYLRRNPPRDFVVATLGQQPLEVSLGIS